MPLSAGINFAIGRIDSRLGIVAAAVPASINGKTWPMPKLASRIEPRTGFLFWAIHPRRTAKTGVVHGDDANPKAIPAAIGANDLGTFSCQIFGSGPSGRGTLINPSKLSPMNIARIETVVGTIAGTWP